MSKLKLGIYTNIYNLNDLKSKTKDELLDIIKEERYRHFDYNYLRSQGTKKYFSDFLESLSPEDRNLIETRIDEPYYAMIARQTAYEKEGLITIPEKQKQTQVDDYNNSIRLIDESDVLSTDDKNYLKEIINDQDPSEKTPLKNKMIQYSDLRIDISDDLPDITGPELKQPDENGVVTDPDVKRANRLYNYLENMSEYKFKSKGLQPPSQTIMSDVQPPSQSIMSQTQLPSQSISSDESVSKSVSGDDILRNIFSKMR